MQRHGRSRRFYRPRCALLWPVDVKILSNCTVWKEAHMPRTSTSPRFTEANKLFMYRLLRDQLGCGRQTFITRVEEVLAQDRLTAEDLGFDSTLQLLEALGADVVKITLFKGGRAYATVLPARIGTRHSPHPKQRPPQRETSPGRKRRATNRSSQAAPNA